MNNIFCAIIPQIERLRKLRIIEVTDSFVLPHACEHPHMLMRLHTGLLFVEKGAFWGALLLHLSPTCKTSNARHPRKGLQGKNILLLLQLDANYSQENAQRDTKSKWESISQDMMLWCTPVTTGWAVSVAEQRQNLSTFGSLGTQDTSLPKLGGFFHSFFPGVSRMLFVRGREDSSSKNTQIWEKNEIGTEREHSQKEKLFFNRTTSPCWLLCKSRRKLWPPGKFLTPWR